MIRGRIRQSSLVFLLLLPLAGLAQQSADYVVIKPVANMYRAPTEDSDVVSQAIFSTNVKAAAVQGTAAPNGWIRVQTADAYKGWMQAIALKRLEGNPYATAGRVVRVAQLSANIYREPDVTAHAPLVTVPWETRLEVADDSPAGDQRWVKVRLPDGRSAFIQSGDIASDLKPISIEQTIQLARKFLGVTYTWGGASSFGFDCSGFTQMLVRQRGIIMPRDADMQAAWEGLYAVERKDLRAGDLLFFGAAPDKITHTGMYIGHGEFIHDTTNTHPMVQISRLDDDPWTKLLVASRRVRQSEQTQRAQEAKTK